MRVSKLFSPECGEPDSELGEECQDHVELKERLRKTLYFGKTPKMDRPSLPMTELAVEFLQSATPRQLGRVDLQWASSVSRKAAVSPCSLMLGMLYIERLKHKNPEYLQKMSSEDLFLISMMVASKYLYDEGTAEEVYNEEWAEWTHLDSEAVNMMEQEFLTAMDWNLYAKEEDFWNSLQQCEERIAWRQATSRGFFSYSDLNVLTEGGGLRRALAAVLAEVCKVLCVCSVAYVAATMTMASAPAALTLAHTLTHTFTNTLTHALAHTRSGSDNHSACHLPDCLSLTLNADPTDVASSGDGSESDGTWWGESLGGWLTVALLRDALMGAVTSRRPPSASPTPGRNGTGHHVRNHGNHVRRPDDRAYSHGDYAYSHGDHAYSHGDHANSHGDHANSHDDPAYSHDDHANNHGNHANSHGDHANSHGNHANSHRDHANSHGDHANSHGNHANSHGDHANSHGDHAYSHGNHANSHGDHADSLLASTDCSACCCPDNTDSKMKFERKGSEDEKNLTCCGPVAGTATCGCLGQHRLCHCGDGKTGRKTADHAASLVPTLPSAAPLPPGLNAQLFTLQTRVWRPHSAG